MEVEERGVIRACPICQLSRSMPQDPLGTRFTRSQPKLLAQREAYTQMSQLPELLTSSAEGDLPTSTSASFVQSLRFHVKLVISKEPIM